MFTKNPPRKFYRDSRSRSGASPKYISSPKESQQNQRGKRLQSPEFLLLPREKTFDRDQVRRRFTKTFPWGVRLSLGPAHHQQRLSTAVQSRPPRAATLCLPGTHPAPTYVEIGHQAGPPTHNVIRAHKAGSVPSCPC